MEKLNITNNPYMFYYSEHKDKPDETIKYWEEYWTGRDFYPKKYKKTDAEDFNKWYWDKLSYLTNYIRVKAHCGSLGADGRIDIEAREDHYLEEFKLIRDKIDELEEMIWPKNNYQC